MKPNGLLMRSSLVVSAITLGGSVVTFGNQLVLAHLFGAGLEMDVYLVSISLPAIVTSLLVGALGYQLVPDLQHARTVQGSEASLLRALEAGLGGGTAVIAVICSWRAGPLVAALNPSLSAAQHKLAAEIAAIAWGSLPFATLVTVYTATLHIRLRFYVAAILGPLPTLTTLVVCLLAHSRIGIAAVAWGQLAGYVLAAIVCRIVLVSLDPCRANWESLRRLLVKLPLGVAGLLLFVIYPFSDAFWGVKIGPSAVSYLGYAQRILVGFSGLAVVGATTVIFPFLAKYAAEGDHLSLHRSLVSSIRTMFAIMGPAAAVFAVLSEPLIGLLFERGAFTGKDTEQLARLLKYMLVGMVAMSMMGLAFKALFALRRIRAAAAISMIGAALYFALSSAGAFAGRVEGIGVAYSITWCGTFIGTCGILGVKLRSLAPFALGIATVSTICAMAALTGQALARLWVADHHAGQIVGLIAGGACALAAYSFLTLVWPGVSELRAVARRVPATDNAN